MYSEGHGPQATLWHLIQNVGVEEWDPASTFFLQVLQVSYVHYHEKNTGLESIISLQHRNSDCLRSMKELCSVHPFKTYFK